MYQNFREQGGALGKLAESHFSTAPLELSKLVEVNKIRTGSEDLLTYRIILPEAARDVTDYMRPMFVQLLMRDISSIKGAILSDAKLSAQNSREVILTMPEQEASRIFESVIQAREASPKRG